MKFGLSFQGASRTGAIERIQDAASVPALARGLAVEAVNALGGNPSRLRVSIAGEEKAGTGLHALAISVNCNG